MKKVIILLVALFFKTSLYAQKSEIVPYMLSFKTEKSIYDIIKDKEKDSLAFFMDRLEGGKYKIHVLFKCTSAYSSSNRKLFINDRFYPLFFDTDYQFNLFELKDNFPILKIYPSDEDDNYQIIKMPDLETRIKNNYIFQKRVPVIMHCTTIYWIIDSNGDLIETKSK